MNQPNPNHPAVTRRALLIGVRTYPKIPKEWGSDLAGCHNDVVNLRRVLLGRGFDDERIHVLIDPMKSCDCALCDGTLSREDALPTRQGILDAVDHLADNCDDDDVVVLYYSGHGSEISGRRLQAGRRFQSLVPHDSGRGQEPNRDISDGEVQGWLRRLRAKTPHVTMIFDCCHSGGLSNVRSGSRGVRQVLEDNRTDDSAYDADLLRALAKADASPDSPLSGGHRGADVSEAAPGGIVLSASAAHELSSETSSDGRKYGLFTYRLCQILEAHEPSEDSAWADVFPEVTAAVTGDNLAQHPRRQGNGPIFEPGPVDPTDIDPPDVVELHKLAVIIGIDYDTSELAPEDRPKNGFAPLRTPHRDAQEVARVLEEVQGYEVVGLSKRSPGPLLGPKANRRRIHKLIHRLIDVRARTRRDCAVLIYFAGHGITRTLDDGSQAGYLVPWGAEQDDPSTWLPMQDLRDQLVDGIRDAERLAAIGVDKPLTRLTSRHLLLVLDCCFGGAMSYDFFRGGDGAQRPIYYSEYRRFVEGRAWQLLNSASYNQQAMDRNPKDPDQPYSPFAQSLIDGLSSAAADRQLGGRSDQIITAAELHQFIDGQLRRQGVDVQTPGLADLRPREGQYIFHVPGVRPTPLPDPPLDPAHNPWPGDLPYDDPELFFGRRQAILELLDVFLRRGDHDLLLTGPSGSGKTSLVAAGLLPLLQDPIGGRERLRRELEYAGDDTYLILQDDRAAVRQWIGEQRIDVTQPVDVLVIQARAAARSCGWWVSEGATAVSEDGTLERTSLGMPSFQDVEDETAMSVPDWWRRLRMDEWLGLPDPQPLTHRLKAWAEKGGLTDFFGGSKGAARRALGSWKVVTVRPDTPLASDLEPPMEDEADLLLWIDDFFSLEQAEGACAASPAWQALETSDRVLRLVGVSKAPTRIAAPWQRLAVPHPTVDELRDVVQGPANARVLEFDPPQLVPRLMDVVAPMPAPLPTMSSWLAYAVEHAWQRRKDADRRLTWRDALDTTIEDWLSRRAEAVTRSLIAQGPAYRASVRDLLLRFLALDGEHTTLRTVSWEELAKVDDGASERLHQHILPRFLEQRVVVADGDGLRLAHPDLLTRWPRLHRWSKPRGTRVRRLFDLWPRASAWRSARFDMGHLLTQDRHLASLVRRRDLSRLEAALVGCSEMVRRSDTVIALTGLASGSLQRNWPRSALLAAEAMAMAHGNGRWMESLRVEVEIQAPDMKARFLPILRTYVKSRHLATQTLHDVLSTTPLGWVLELPEDATGELRGLAITDHCVGARLVSSNAARNADGDAHVHLFAWDLPDDLTATGDRVQEGGPEEGAGEVTPWKLPGGPILEFPMVPGGLHRGPKAQTGHDHGIRLFLPGRHGLPAEVMRFVAPPITLWGHTQTPTFLAFCEDRHWLASAAQPAGGKPEIRLWPLRLGGAMPAQPLTFLGGTLRQLEQGEGDASGLLEVNAQSPGFDRPRSAFSPEDLPTEVAFGNVTWRLTGRASGAVVASRTDPERHLTLLAGKRPEPSPRRPKLPALAPPGRPKPPTEFQSLTFSPGGRWLTLITDDQEMVLWDLQQRRVAWRTEQVTCLAFHPSADTEATDSEAQKADSPLAVLGHPRGSLRILRRDLQLECPDHGDLGRISSLTFDPDGSRLAIGALDGTVRLVDVNHASRQAGDPTRQPLVLLGPRDRGFAVQDLRFDAAGRRLAVQRRAVYEPFSTRVDVYQLDDDTLICLARGHAGRALDASDMPPAIWRHVEEARPYDPDSDTGFEPESERSRDRRRYAQILGNLSFESER